MQAVVMHPRYLRPPSVVTFILDLDLEESFKKKKIYIYIREIP